MSAAKQYRLIVFAVSLIIALSALGCANRQPVKVAFVAGLTGRQSDIGVAGRNGAVLAVEEMNKAGGILGRPVELIVKDDKNDPNVVRAVDEELVRAEVEIIIGHMTSAAAVAALPVVADGKALIISPTARADILSGRDDLFISVMPPLKVSADHQAMYAINKLGLKQMVVVYDLSNPDFSQAWADAFAAKYEEMGGKVIAKVAFTSGSGVPYERLTKDVAAYRPEGVLLVASAVDAAMLSQWIRKSQLTVPLLSSSWGMTADFIYHGGQAVEGVIFSSPFIPDDRGQAYNQFVSKYQERFGSQPNFAAAYGYEAAQVALAGMKKAGNNKAQAVKNAIIAQSQFPGIRSDIAINATGDASRECWMVTVKNGQFVTLDY
ncbi:ABC transporter substrate-binding protein [Sporomusa malonica]|uniref:Amino acid/amide ABC transporter substrate-binding protein, HAAT family n=1 Tax=Sporomusa malonica TaxID=112901 RepID=A0A1W2ETW3_9FIRM|nr:ABC transporter substrate-binding protein [Sporomusa malonica]SMD12618.1 amino acid/amide ABC transporter substrate-binding protein, HAAT family [Sporomusa malonica]